LGEEVVVASPVVEAVHLNTTTYITVVAEVTITSMITGVIMAEDVFPLATIATTTITLTIITMATAAPEANTMSNIVSIIPILDREHSGDKNKPQSSRTLLLTQILMRMITNS